MLGYGYIKRILGPCHKAEYIEILMKFLGDFVLKVGL